MIDRSHQKLGKAQHRHDPRTLHLEDYIAPNIAYPSSYDQSNAYVWQMWLNNQLGCCTISSSAGQTCAWCAHLGGITIPDSSVLKSYEDVGRYKPGRPDTDQGAVELDVLKYRQKVGLQDSTNTYHKIWAFAGISHWNAKAVNTAIYLFDNVYIGLALPFVAQKMGKVWDLPQGQALTGDWQPGSWGGHAVIVVAYDEGTGDRKIVTWSEVVTVTERFWNAYVDEVWAVVSPDWINKNPDGFNLKQLNTDLRLVQKWANGRGTWRQRVCSWLHL